LNLGDILVPKYKVCFWIIPFTGLVAFGLYIFLIPHYPHLRPAYFEPLPTGSNDGRLVPLTLKPNAIYGMGLTYSTHIKETASIQSEYSAGDLSEGGYRPGFIQSGGQAARPKRSYHQSGILGSRIGPHYSYVFGMTSAGGTDGDFNKNWV
jgi:hypothetical protein